MSLLISATRSPIGPLGWTYGDDSPHAKPDKKYKVCFRWLQRACDMRPFISHVWLDAAICVLACPVSLIYIPAAMPCIRFIRSNMRSDCHVHYPIRQSNVRLYWGIGVQSCPVSNYLSNIPAVMSYVRLYGAKCVPHVLLPNIRNIMRPVLSCIRLYGAICVLHVL